LVVVVSLEVWSKRPRAVRFAPLQFALQLRDRRTKVSLAMLCATLLVRRRCSIGPKQIHRAAAVLVLWLAFGFPGSVYVAANENVDRDGLHRATFVEKNVHPTLKVDNQIGISLQKQLTFRKKKGAYI
jgi:hypothetical protein